MMNPDILSRKGNDRGNCYKQSSTYAHTLPATACKHAMACDGMRWHAMACNGMPWHVMDSKERERERERERESQRERLGGTERGQAPATCKTEPPFA